jgi:hypothetical protein
MREENSKDDDNYDDDYNDDNCVPWRLYIRPVSRNMSNNCISLCHSKIIQDTSNQKIVW